MNALERLPQPLDWSAPSDHVVQQAVDRQSDLHRQWREAEAAAREAEERIAHARADDEQRRAVALADGQNDPGPLPLGKHEKGATEAAGRRDVLRLAYGRARERALELAAEREDDWQQATAKRVDVARGAVGELIAEIEQRFQEFGDASLEDLLAHHPEAREVRVAKVAAGAPQLPGSLDEWRTLVQRAPELGPGG